MFPYFYCLAILLKNFFFFRKKKMKALAICMYQQIKAAEEKKHIEK